MLHMLSLLLWRIVRMKKYRVFTTSVQQAWLINPPRLLDPWAISSFTARLSAWMKFVHVSLTPHFTMPKGKLSKTKKQKKNDRTPSSEQWSHCNFTDWPLAREIKRRKKKKKDLLKDKSDPTHSFGAATFGLRWKTYLWQKRCNIRALL